MPRKKKPKNDARMPAGAMQAKETKQKPKSKPKPNPKPKPKPKAKPEEMAETSVEESMFNLSVKDKKEEEEQEQEQEQEEKEEEEEEEGEQEDPAETARREREERLRLEQERKEKERIEKEKKLAKAAKKRNKKKDKEREREKRIADEQANVVSMRDVELEAINQKLTSEKLKIKEIPSDGNCMFRAVVDQLDSAQANAASYTHSSLRKAVVNYMRTHPGSFAAFLSEEDGDFQSYCTKMETTAAWGGNLELQAIVGVLQSEIWVYSASAPTLKMGTEYHDEGGQPLQLSYHMHYYALGEHYNSVALA